MKKKECKQYEKSFREWLQKKENVDKWEKFLKNDVRNYFKIEITVFYNSVFRCRNTLIIKEL